MGTAQKILFKLPLNGSYTPHETEPPGTARASLLHKRKLVLRRSF